MGTIVSQQTRFVDLNLAFTQNPQTKDVSKKTNIEAIKFAVRNLILTSHYEKPFHPEIGTPIRQMLFENSSPIVGLMIEKVVTQVLQQYEPRAILKGVTVTMKDDENSCDITITFQPTTINQLVEFTILVERLR